MAEVGKRLRTWQKHKQVLCGVERWGQHLAYLRVVFGFNLIMVYPIAYSASYVIGIVLSFSIIPWWSSQPAFIQEIRPVSHGLPGSVFIESWLADRICAIFMVSETLAPIFVLPSACR